MKDRLQRYEDFIQNGYLRGLTRNKEYSLDEVSDELKAKARSGQFKKLVFTGMGCSAIVSDMIKGFIIDEGLPIWVEVLNDHAIEYLVAPTTITDPSTLVIISSYSGNSIEPLQAYEKMKHLTPNIVFLTSGGKLESVAQRDGISVIKWELVGADREYPLFHAPQFFSILLDAFYALGIFPNNYEDMLHQAAASLRAGFEGNTLLEAEELAARLYERNIVILASPKWDTALVKLLRMHLNEIAMAPAYRNTFHEFTHSEIASYSDPHQPVTFLILRDRDDHDFTIKQIDVFLSVMTDETSANRNIDVAMIDVLGADFIEKQFQALLFVSHVCLYLGKRYNTKSRDLISRAAGNPWYSSEMIEREDLQRAA